MHKHVCAMVDDFRAVVPAVELAHGVVLALLDQGHFARHCLPKTALQRSKTALTPPLSQGVCMPCL